MQAQHLIIKESKDIIMDDGCNYSCIDKINENFNSYVNDGSESTNGFHNINVDFLFRFIITTE
jgi:hypothetical protein